MYPEGGQRPAIYKVPPAFSEAACTPLRKRITEITLGYKLALPGGGRLSRAPTLRDHHPPRASPPSQGWSPRPFPWETLLASLVVDLRGDIYNASMPARGCMFALRRGAVNQAKNLAWTTAPPQSQKTFQKWCCWVLQTCPAPKSAGRMGSSFSFFFSPKRSKLGFRGCFVLSGSF